MRNKILKFFFKFSLACRENSGKVCAIERLFWGEQQPVVAFAAAGCIRFRVIRFGFFTFSSNEEMATLA